MLKKIGLIYLFGIISIISLGQSQNLPNNLLQLNFNTSKHGTGDIRGVAFNSGYSYFFSKKYCWIVEVGGTLHDGSRPLFYTAPNGNTIDGSIRYTTGGIQSKAGIGYNFIRTPKHNFHAALSSLLRYQSSSYYDDVTILFPAGTGLPVPVVYFENKTPARTFAIGGSISLSYNYTLKNRISLGMIGSFQTDSNGDALSQIGLAIGKRF